MKINKYISESVKKYLEEEFVENHTFPNYWYHGSNKYFEKFSLDYSGKNFKTSKLGIYFTQYKQPPPYSSTAKEYAEEMVRRYGGTPYIYTCKIHINNPLILDSSGWYSSNTYIDKNRNDISRWLNNNDCVIVYNKDTEKSEGLRWGDYILATNNIDIIEIVDISEV